MIVVGAGVVVVVVVVVLVVVEAVVVEVVLVVVVLINGVVLNVVRRSDVDDIALVVVVSFAAITGVTKTVFVTAGEVVVLKSTTMFGVGIVVGSLIEVVL